MQTAPYLFPLYLWYTRHQKQTFEGEKQGEEFVLKSILVENIEDVLSYKEESKDLESESSNM